MKHPLSKLKIEDLKHLGGDLYTEKTPEEKAIEKLKQAGAKETEKAIKIFNNLINEK